MGPPVVLGAVGLKVLHDVGHLHLQLLLSGVVGEDAGKEQLFIVGVGGEQQQIRLLTGPLPHLHPVGEDPAGESIDVSNYRPLGEAEGDVLLYPIGEAGHVDVLVKKALLPAGIAPAAALYRIGLRQAVKLDIEGGDGGGTGDLHRRALPGGGIGAPVAVPQPLGGGEALGGKGGVLRSGLIGGDGDRQAQAQKQDGKKAAHFHRPSLTKSPRRQQFFVKIWP